MSTPTLDRNDSGTNAPTTATGGTAVDRQIRALRWGRLSAVLRPRHLIAALALLVAAALAFAINIGQGDYPLSIPQVFEVLFGGGNRLERLVVLEWRMGRTMVGLVVGLALGLAGALTQSVSRNPLASPDILGISQGASAAVVTVLVMGTSVAGLTVPAALLGGGTAAIALVGGLITAAVIYLLAWRRGIDPFRLVLVGIGINAMLTSVITFMIVRADINTAAQAKVWLTGSLAGQGWPQFWPVLICLAVAVIALALVSYDLQATQLGDDAARALGVRLRVSQGVMLLIAVGLTAITVSAAGPIGFVAFVAPQLALRLCRTATPPLIGSALTGAALLLLSDWVARVVLPWELPVGIVTAAIGGPFLLHLVIQTNRKASA